MSQIGVDERTYNLMYHRAYVECLNRYRGDTIEARRLTAYYMRDWYVITDYPRRTSNGFVQQTTN